VFGSSVPMISATSAFRAGSKVRQQRPNLVSLALCKGEQNGAVGESVGGSHGAACQPEERRSCVETTAGERADENEEPRAEGAASQPCRANPLVRVERESQRELASAKAVRGDRTSAQFAHR